MTKTEVLHSEILITSTVKKKKKKVAFTKGENVESLMK